MTNPSSTHLPDAELNAWLDGALEAPARAAADAHIAGCQVCANRLADLQVVFARLDAWPDVLLQRDLGPGVQAAIAATRPVARPLRGALLAQAAAALVAMALSMPVLTGGIGHLDVSAWAFGLPAAVEPFGADTARAASGFINALSSEVQSFAAGLSANAALTLQSFAGALGTCASIVALVWLAGNTVLIRPKIFRSRRHP